MHNRESSPKTNFLVQTRGFQSWEVRTNKIQGIATIAIHARCADIHSPIEVVVPTVANDGALHVPTRSIRLDEVG